LDWLKLAPNCLRTLTGRSSEQQQLDRKWRGDPEGEEEAVVSHGAVLYFCKPPSGTAASPVILLDIAADGQMTFLQINRKCRRLKLSDVC
jgi:hypothetical protein